MLTVNIHKAKTHLSRLLDRTARGEPFIIAKAGKPIVKVVPLETPEAGQVRRLGFMAGQIAVPDDFDRMGSPEIERLFGSGSGDGVDHSPIPSRIEAASTVVHKPRLSPMADCVMFMVRTILLEMR